MARFGTKFLATGILLLLLFAAKISPVDAFDLIVELPSSIEARAGEFLLGEYALLEGDAEVADSVSMVWITPLGGVFTREDVVRALGSSKATGRSVLLRMPDVVTVRPECEIASELRARTIWRWRIEVGEIPEALSGKFTLPPRILPGARTVSARFTDSDGRLFRRQLKVRWYQPVVYALQNIPAGSEPDVTALTTRVSTVGMEGTYLWDVSLLKGARTRQSIGAGRPIALLDLERTQVVRAGSVVTIVAVVNGLAIEAKGMALQRGNRGDIIKVRNLSSKKILSGRVAGVGRVEID